MIDQIPHIEQYDGLWLMHGPAMQNIMHQVNAMDLRSHVATRLQMPESRSASDDDRYEMVGDGIAVISIEGAMTKYGSSLSRADSTIELRRSVRAAAADASVRGIMLRIDSPGGQAAGTSDLADDIASAGKVKPVHAYIEDIGASAGYWIASQTKRITVNRTALVGSIGTYAALIDYSGVFAEPGNGAGPIRTIEIKSTPLKGTGLAPGAKITDAQIENMQREINEINDEFKAAVQRGRKYTNEQIESLADARVHVGQNAVEIGLADAVGSMDDAIGSLTNSIQGGRTVRSPGSIFHADTKETSMSRKKTGLVRPTSEEYDEDEIMDDEEVMDEEDTTTEEEEVMDEDEIEVEDDEEDGDPAATLRELKAQIPDSTADFREQCIEQGLSLAQAKDRWMDTLRAQLQNRNEQLSSSRPRPGVKRLRSTNNKPSASSNVREQIAEKRDKLMATGMNRAEAHKRVMRENPELRAAYVQAANDGRPRKRR